MSLAAFAGRTARLLLVRTKNTKITKTTKAPRWRRAHFFRVLEETGHVQMAAEAAGVSLGCIYRLRRKEAGFTEKMIAAVAKADRRLREQKGG